MIEHLLVGWQKVADNYGKTIYVCEHPLNHTGYIAVDNRSQVNGKVLYIVRPKQPVEVCE